MRVETHTFAQVLLVRESSSFDLELGAPPLQNLQVIALTGDVWMADLLTFTQEKSEFLIFVSAQV